VANTFLTATKISRTGLGLLQREIVLPGLVWTNVGADFVGATNATVDIRVPARTRARRRALGVTRPTASEGEGIITMDELTETSVPVQLTDDVYNAIPVTDEDLTLKIENFGQQILQPQMLAVAEGLEEMVAAEMLGATYATTLTLDTTDPYYTFVDGRQALNDANVPKTERVAVVGSAIEAVLLKSKHLSEVDKSGSDSALRDAEIGRLAGFGVVHGSNALPPNVGFVFHRTAYVLAMRAPNVPDGASSGSSQTYQGLAMRWIRDYDFRNQQDRSLVNVYAGTNIVADGKSNEIQTATITGTPTGGTFTLTYAGQTTSAIAYNATAATVRTALENLSTVGYGNVNVTGSAGGPYTVTFTGSLAGTNVAQMTATPSLTGGTSPTVNIATSSAGAQTTFVRAVKIVMA
jgi:hypothetical protein